MGAPSMATAKTPEKTPIEIIAELEARRDRYCKQALSYLEGQVADAIKIRDTFIEKLKTQASHALRWDTPQMIQAVLCLDVLRTVITNMKDEPNRLHLYLEDVCKGITRGFMNGAWAEHGSNEMSNLKNTWEWQERGNWLQKLQPLDDSLSEVENGLLALGREMFHVEHEEKGS